MKTSPHIDKIAQKQSPSVIGRRNRPNPPAASAAGRGGQANAVPCLPGKTADSLQRQRKEATHYRSSTMMRASEPAKPSMV